jgi:hypothetical protein
VLGLFAEKASPPLPEGVTNTDPRALALFALGEVLLIGRAEDAARKLECEVPNAQA